MALVTIASDTHERDVEITLKRHDLDIGVERMFDADGSETFDPTEAVEIDGEGQLLDLQAGVSDSRISSRSSGSAAA